MTFHSKRRVLTVIDPPLASDFQFCKAAEEVCRKLHTFLKPFKEKNDATVFNRLGGKKKGKQAV